MPNHKPAAPTSPKKAPNPANLLRSAQVLERYPQLSYRTLTRLITDGKLTAYHLAGGRVRLLDPDEIDALFAAAAS